MEPKSTNLNQLTCYEDLEHNLVLSFYCYHLLLYLPFNGYPIFIGLLIFLLQR